MNRHIRRILDGEDSEIRSLRKNDEFKELYDSLTELSERYRSMKGK
jgi:signal transduction histidine kinase